jgi:hypothetical protein
VLVCYAIDVVSVKWQPYTKASTKLTHKPVMSAANGDFTAVHIDGVLETFLNKRVK